MIKFFVDRPLGTFIGFIGLFILGVLAFNYSPKSLLPEIPIPKIKIIVDESSYDARTIDEKIMKILRRDLKHVYDLSDIYTESSDGRGYVLLSFNSGVNMNLAFIEVNEKLDAASAMLPIGLKRPLVVKNTTNQLPIYRFNIYARASVISQEKFQELSALSSDIILKRIQQLSAVSSVDMTGQSSIKIEIVARPEIVNPLSLSNEDLFKYVQDLTSKIGTLVINEQNTKSYINISSEIADLEALENLPITVGGRTFKLGYLASLRTVAEDNFGDFYFNGNRAINMLVSKKSTIPMIDFKTQFKDLVLQLQKDYPDLVFTISQDQSLLLDVSMGNLVQDLLLGGLIAVLMMVIFIRRVKSALLVIVAIPITLFITQIGFFLLGISINIISLGGLILGLAMIIDNSIVVVDSINSKRQAGATLRNAVIEGTEDIVKPTLTALLTNCSVFIPLIYLSGLAGVLFYDQALSICLGVTASLLVAIFFIPALYLIAYSSESDYTIPHLTDITGKVEHLTIFFLRRPYWVFIGGAVIFLFGVFGYSKIEKAAFPNLTKSDFVLLVNWQEDVSKEEGVTRLKKVMEGCPEIQNSSFWIETQKYLIKSDESLEKNEVKAYFQVDPTVNIDVIKNKLKQNLQSLYPMSTFSFGIAKNAFDEIFDGEGEEFELNVKTNDNQLPDVINSKFLVKTIGTKLNRNDITQVMTSKKGVLSLDVQKLVQYNVSYSDLKKAVESAFSSKLVYNMNIHNSLLPVYVVGKNFADVESTLRNSFVKNNDNGEVPLNRIISYKLVEDHKKIFANSGENFLKIDIPSSQQEKDLDILENFKAETGGHYNVSITGRYFKSELMIKEMLFILLISLFLLYTILAAQFESLVQPLFVLIEIPIAIGGSLLLLMVSENSLNIMSLIGIIVMSGLIINDSVLKLDAINKARKFNKSLIMAILIGGRRRLKAIIMISFASIGSLIPTIFMDDIGSELQKPLAITIIGGMSVGLFVSLFLVPILYWKTYQKK